MIGKQHVLAQRYARAWTLLRISGPTGSASYEGQGGDVVEKLRAWLPVWNDRTVMSYLRLEQISDETKTRIILQEADKRGLVQIMEPLVRLLVCHKRLALLGAVIQSYVTQYYRLHKIEDITVESVVALTSEEHVVINDWVMRSRGARQVRIHNTINTSLIAGMRIMGDEFLWEHSVRQQLSVLAKLYKDV